MLVSDFAMEFVKKSVSLLLFLQKVGIMFHRVIWEQLGYVKIKQGGKSVEHALFLVQRDSDFASQN